ncbi:MAG: sugar phosphate isomerase/epimerase family protein [Candidatus Limnocylindrales bacterium]
MPGDSAQRDYAFGVSEFTTWPWSFERDVEAYARAGIEALELTEFKLNRDDYDPQLALLASSGLQVSSVQSTVHSLFPDSLAPQPTAPADRLRHMKAAIARIAPRIPQGTPFVVITGAAPGGDTEHVVRVAIDLLGDLAEYAADHGVRIAFEPLNPVLFNTDTAVWGLDDGLNLVQAVGHPNLGLCLDSWNVWQTPDLVATIARCADRIFLVQVSDWRRPRSGADLVSLGDGTIDNALIVGAARRAGYDRPYVLEIFSAESLPGSIWREPLDDVIRRNRVAFGSIWARSLANPTGTAPG